MKETLSLCCGQVRDEVRHGQRHLHAAAEGRAAVGRGKVSGGSSVSVPPPLYTPTPRYECQIIVAINNKVTQSLFLRVEEPPIINDNSTRSIVVNEFEVS